MTVKSVPTMGWTRGSVAATILLVTQQQREALAERVRTEMEQRGWNNPKLARESGLSEKTISRVINARKDPRLDTLERIAEAFGFSEQELRGERLAPLGLGAQNDQATQLDRIEAMLVYLYFKVTGERYAATTEEILGQLPGRLAETNGSQSTQAPGQSENDDQGESRKSA